MSRDLSPGFLADVVETPGDDTPRLVLADWLDDHGQPEPAEFIRVQLERARLPEWDAAQVRLRAREAVLLARHGTAWCAALPALRGVSWGGFRRGFVAEALTSFAALRGEAWRRAAPIEAATVKWPKKGETISLGAGLRELTLSGWLVAFSDAERLAESELLSDLRVLDVTGCALGLEGLRRVVASPHLGRLLALRAADNSLGDGVGLALGSAPALGALEELDLSESGGAGYYGENVFTAEGMAELGAWPGMLRIDGKKCSDADLDALSASALGRRLLLLDRIGKR